MRKDIEIHINTGDITLVSKKQYTLCDFQWVENQQGLVRYIYGEITVPSIITDRSIKSQGLYVKIPYTPKYKEFMVRVKRSYSAIDFSYLQNPVDGSDWFLVKAAIYGQSYGNVFASQLKIISDDDFYCVFNKGVIDIYSAKKNDLNIIRCKRQNANMMLSCVPTNNYRYPLSGVGLIRWKNGNMSRISLSDRIMSEFNDDGVIVNNASFNYDTSQMSLDLKEMS